MDTTKDQVLTSDGKRIQTYYYSTSWGKSASGKEVWETDREVDYLQSCMQQDGGKNKTLRLSEEKQFREFIAKKRMQHTTKIQNGTVGGYGSMQNN